MVKHKPRKFNSVRCLLQLTHNPLRRPMGTLFRRLTRLLQLESYLNYTHSITLYTINLTMKDEPNCTQNNTGNFKRWLKF